jgi:hypothetical protein
MVESLRLSMQSAVGRFISTHKLRRRRMGSGVEDVTTHLFMDGFCGGAISVPDELHSEFLEACVKDTVATVTHFIVEKCTPVFRMFVDIDHLGKNRGLTELEICRLARHLQNEAKLFFPPHPPAAAAAAASASSSSSSSASSSAAGAGAATTAGKKDRRFDVAVLTTEVSLKNIGGGAKGAKGYKTGVHLIMPHLHVDNDMARCIHASLVSALNDKEPSILQGSCESWERMIDATVYERGTGDLRMIHSHKSDKCPTCKNVKEHKLDCTDCHSSGRIDLGRPYKITNYILSSGSRAANPGNSLGIKPAKYFTNPYTMIRLFTVRTPRVSPTPGFEIHAQCPPIMNVGVSNIVGSRSGARERARASFSDRMTKNAYPDHPKTQEIRGHYDSCLRSIDIRLPWVKDLLAHINKNGQPCTREHVMVTRPDGGPPERRHLVRGTCTEAVHRSELRLGVSTNHADGSRCMHASVGGATCAGTDEGDICVERPMIYSRLRINKIQYGGRKGRDSFYIVHVEGHGSAFCQNKGASHTSSTIYFHVTDEGLTQRCWSWKSDKDDTGLRYGPCRYYDSPVSRLPNELRHAMFPHTIDTTRKLMASTATPVEQLQYALLTRNEHPESTKRLACATKRKSSAAAKNYLESRLNNNNTEADDDAYGGGAGASTMDANKRVRTTNHHNDLIPITQTPFSIKPTANLSSSSSAASSAATAAALYAELGFEDDL